MGLQVGGDTQNKGNSAPGDIIPSDFPEYTHCAFVLHF